MPTRRAGPQQHSATLGQEGDQGRAVVGPDRPARWIARGKATGAAAQLTQRAGARAAFQHCHAAAGVRDQHGATVRADAERWFARSIDAERLGINAAQDATTVPWLRAQ